MSFRRRLHKRALLCGLSGLFAVLTAADGHAAIAPQYERVRQFGFAMQAANEAASKLSAHGPIDILERMDDGTFRFRAGRCFVPVRLEYAPARTERPMAGVPSHYNVSLGDVRCD